MKIPKRRISVSIIIIILYAITIPLVNFNHHRYSGNEGVIIWDIKSYYAYLPAAFIYKDLSLKFIDKNPKKFEGWIWPIKTPKGEKAILTTIGLSVLYSPFFFIAHGYAKLTGNYKADGYSYPYHVALTFSAYIYFILALIILRKVLLKYFTDLSTSIAIIAIGAGTNLFYYVTYEAPMSHAYNFFLIILFVFVLEQWHKYYSLKYTMLLGLISGLISLIRPTNTIVLLLIPLYNVNSITSFRENIIGLIRKWPKLLVMAVFFILIWVPQFIYWYKVADKVFYFSYGEVGGSFYFNNPQIIDMLFSYGKGWFIYTPIMLFATIGIYYLFVRKQKNAFAILVYFLLNLFILSSWWSWWYGGGYSNRALVDFYGIMAFPLAAFIQQSWKTRLRKVILLLLICVLTFFNQFQVQQYRRGVIDAVWMNKEAYWTNFMRLHAKCKYWNIRNRPDYDKARKGAYETTFYLDSNVSREAVYNKLYTEFGNDTLLLDSLRIQAIVNNEPVEKLKEDYINELINKGHAKQEYKELRIDYLKNQMRNCWTWNKEIERKAKRNSVSFDEMAGAEAERIFEKYSQKYIMELY
jgi:hypothetical protein